MDLKVYEKTRWENIYRHKKNKNYLISINKPVKTSISKYNDDKIFDIELAKKIRDDSLLKTQKGLETHNKGNFDTIYNKYRNNYIYIKKLAYNSIDRKTKTYNKYLKNKIDKPLSKIDKNFWSEYVDGLECSLKQKNHVLKELSAFYNWCIEENIVLFNPINKIKRYKIPKKEMDFFTSDEIKTIIKILDQDIESENIKQKNKAYRIKILFMLNFHLGARIGEIRALHFNDFNINTELASILHSINYDKKSKDFVSSTKTYGSQRILDSTKKIINEVNNYKDYLKNKLFLPVKDSDLIFFNYNTMRPISDVTLRKQFHYYCRKANVKEIRLYDIRHTFAADMMEQGEDAYVFGPRMGHKNISTTINQYGHLSKKVRKRVAKNTEKYF